MNSETSLAHVGLPTQDLFHNDLTKEDCTDADYTLANKAWTQFRCVTMQDYMLAYLKMDVCQLADVYTQFRRTAIDKDSGLSMILSISLECPDTVGLVHSNKQEPR